MIDDAISAMKVAIYETAKKFDPTRGIDFKAYIRLRAHGSVIDFLRGIGGKRPGSPLTKAEQKVQKLMVETALTNKDIGKQLGINEKTVKCHTRSVFLKQRVRNRLDLIIKWYRDPSSLRAGVCD